MDKDGLEFETNKDGSTFVRDHHGNNADLGSYLVGCAGSDRVFNNGAKPGGPTEGFALLPHQYETAREVNRVVSTLKSIVASDHAGYVDASTIESPLVKTCKNLKAIER